MDTGTQTLVVWTKTLKTKDGNSFPSVKGQVIKQDGSRSNTYSVVLLNSCKEQMRKDGFELKKGTGLALDLDRDDYFPTKKWYTRKDGTRAYEVVIKIKSYSGIRVINFESKSLEDLD